MPRKKPGVKLREKGKKESQVFTSVADNPRQGTVVDRGLAREPTECHAWRPPEALTDPANT
jgi:hypothetical protein